MSKRFLLVLVLFLSGCTNMQPMQDDLGNPLSPDQAMNSFKDGKLRLTCDVSCAFSEGYYGEELKALYLQRKWSELVKAVIEVGYPSDRNYFFLGMAAGGLGYLEPASVYYRLSLNVSQSNKCTPSFGTCEGLKFPEYSRSRLNIVSKSIARQEEERKRAELKNAQRRERLIGQDKQGREEKKESSSDYPLSESKDRRAPIID